MNHRPENLYSVNERTERLICRRLDGEITAAERDELDRILATDPAARMLLSDYAQIDAAAAQTLQYDFNLARTAVRPRQLGGFRLAAAGAVLAAAAVIALSFLPSLFRPQTIAPSEFAASSPHRSVEPIAPYRNGGAREAAPMFVDYRNTDYLPRHRQQDVLRDVIGIPARNEKNQDVIYIFERNTEHTRIVPMSGDF